MDTLAMSEASVKRAGASAGGRDDEALVLPSEVGCLWLRRC
jgi:hypothetical protein